ncbi:hypothetical protein [Methanosarcina mazei]|uniref:Uncharacterized protein n=1 Tax=Methanosarcina mazei TaxID=2209 RepID=A0A0F8KQH6_METMZ|nr:hypothetical protein [Methanosarcina mazei]KKG83065.1 hypothetical protein DU55_08175 [Methanosarcina mazei]
MDFYNFLLEPTFNKTLSEMGEIVLPVTGVLLGLVYTAHIYWLQGGFSKLEYTKSLLEDLLVADGKIILDLLIGASVISLFSIIESVSLISVIFYIFCLFFVTDLCKYTAEVGYIQTLFSTKFIPSNYGYFKTYIKKILNAGFKGWAKPLLFGFLVVFYPLIASYDSISSGVFTLNNNSIIIFMLTSTLLSFIQVKSLLTEAFKFRKDIEKRLEKQKDNINQSSNQESNWEESKRRLESKIVLECLESIGIILDSQDHELISRGSWTSRNLSSKPILNGNPIIDKNGSCHLNLIIPYLEDDSKTRAFIFLWTKEIFELLASSKTEIYDYAVSFFRKENDLSRTHFALIRANRKTIIKLMNKSKSTNEFIKNITGKYLAESIDKF